MKKKLFSLAVTLVMALSLAVPAMAAGGEYSITINDAQTGKTYEAYQIFAGTWSDSAENLVDITWGSGVNGTALLADLKSDATLGTFFADAASAAAVADVLSGNEAFEQDNDLMQKFADVVGANLTETTAGTANTNPDGQYVISGIDGGYYLVQNSAVGTAQAKTRFILEVVDDATASPKSTDIPVGEKTVGDGENVGSYDIGDKIPFQLTVTLPAAGTMATYDTYYLQLKDTMDTGLEYNDDAVVYFSEDATLNVEEDTDITASFTKGTEGGSTFSLTCTDIKAIEDISVDGGETIFVVYSADLTDEAPMATQIGNKFEYTYSNDPNGAGSGNSVPDETTVYTYQLTVTKTDADTDAELKDAKFNLLLDGTALKFTQDMKTGVYTYDTNGSTELSTTFNGQYKAIVIQGLAAGEYQLKETKAPEGYNLLIDPVSVVVGYADTNNDGDADDSTLIESNATIDVDNNTGAVLPGTGGMGTTIFYVVGGTLVVAAAVLLITKKRMHNAED